MKVECLNEEPSPHWSEWSEWSDCSKKCKEDGTAGERERRRKCAFAVDASHCDGDDVHSEKCNDIECTWTQLRAWTNPFIGFNLKFHSHISNSNEGLRQ